MPPPDRRNDDQDSFLAQMWRGLASGLGRGLGFFLGLLVIGAATVGGASLAFGITLQVAAGLFVLLVIAVAIFAVFANGGFL